jgi:SAM-dependent methyltransferase
MFIPSFLGIFINPMYFIRNGIIRGVLSNKKYLTGRLLDFGCGNKPYAELIDVKEYIGLEIEDDNHIQADKNIEAYYDGKTIPFSDNYFDSILSSEVFEHVFNLEQILKELNRVLKPGGHMLITVPFVWEEHSIPNDFARYTSFGIRDLLVRSGFSIISAEKTTNYVETVFQMWGAYIYQSVFPKNKLAKAILTPVFIAPITITGIFLSWILPKNKNFYHNNIITARK